MSNIVTVAISTFKDSRFNWIEDLVKSLEKQTIQDFEVIIVVSRDRQYFKKLKNKVENELDIKYKINVVFNAHDKGIAHSRNTALAHIKTQYVAYTDDDAIPHPMWLEELLSVFNQYKKVGAVTGPVIAKWETHPKDAKSWFPEELYWILGCTTWKINNITEVRNGFASNLLIRKDLLVNLKGFNECLGYNPKNPMVGEETELGMRLNKAGYFTFWSPNAVVYHRILSERIKLNNVLRRSFIEGKTKAFLAKEYGNNELEKESNQFKVVLRKLFDYGSLTAKTYLVLSTLAVLAAFLIYTIIPAEYSRLYDE